MPRYGQNWKRVWGIFERYGSQTKIQEPLKVCLSKRKEDMAQEQVERLAKVANNLGRKKGVGGDIAYRAGLEPGYVAIEFLA
ncbi:MAG: hypothetical protein Ct9H90mP24_8020 [Methanobacteriota archaeon]|nr:MAG: hypothetical protein Ct9H90mP24_8020 [Euryarchaeota archaeon]